MSETLEEKLGGIEGAGSRESPEVNMDPELLEQIEQGLHGFIPGARSYEEAREELKDVLENKPEEARAILERKFLDDLENGYIAQALAIREELLDSEVMLDPKTVSQSALGGLQKNIILAPYRTLDTGSIKSLLDLVDPEDGERATEIIKRGVIDRLQKGAANDALGLIDKFLGQDEDFLSSDELKEAAQTCFAEHIENYGSDKLIDRFHFSPEFVQEVVKKRVTELIERFKRVRMSGGMDTPLDSALRLARKYGAPDEISAYEISDELQTLASENNLQNLAQLITKLKGINPTR